MTQRHVYNIYRPALQHRALSFIKGHIWVFLESCSCFFGTPYTTWGWGSDLLRFLKNVKSHGPFYNMLFTYKKGNFSFKWSPESTCFVLVWFWLSHTCVFLAVMGVLASCFSLLSWWEGAGESGRRSPGREPSNSFTSDPAGVNWLVNTGDLFTVKKF